MRKVKREWAAAAWLLCVVWMLAVLYGCDRRPLEEETTGRVTIPIKIYWDLANVAPENATVMFYASDGSLYKEEKFASFPTYAEGEAALEPGDYTVVAFNELRDQIDYVRMRGWERLDTFEAYAVPNPNPAYQFVSQVGSHEVQVHEPGILAACVTTIQITPEMLVNQAGAATRADWQALTNLHPLRKTAQATMKVHVGGLNNARMPAIAELRNMASAYFFATDRNSLLPVTAQFTMNNRTYDSGSNTDGTISATITTFGVLGEWHHTGDTPDARFYLGIAFMLVDAEQTIIETSTDITELIEIIVDENSAVTIYVEMDAPPLPVVKPIHGDSGFSTDLVEWDKVVVPLN